MSAHFDPDQADLLCYAYTVGGRHYLDSLQERGVILKGEGGSICWDRRAALETAQRGITYPGEYGTHSAGLWRTTGVPCTSDAVPSWRPDPAGWTCLPEPVALEPDPLWLGQRKRLNTPCNKMVPAVNWYRALARHGSRIMAVEHEREVIFLNLAAPAEDWLGAWFPDGLADADLIRVMEAFLSGPPAGRDDDPLPPGMRDLLGRLGSGNALVKSGVNIYRHYKRPQYEALRRGMLMCGWADCSLREVSSWFNIERWAGAQLAWAMTSGGDPVVHLKDPNPARKVFPEPWKNLIRIKWEGQAAGLAAWRPGSLTFWEDPARPTQQVLWPAGGWT
jgi:hypothetical protein